MKFEVFDAFVEGVQVIDPNFKYLYVNPAVAAQARSTVNALLGNKMVDMFPGIEHSRAYSEIGKCMEGGEDIEFLSEFDDPRGHKSYFKLRVHRIDEGVLVVSHDLTEEKQKQYDLLTQNHKLEEQIQERSRQLEDRKAELEEYIYRIEALQSLYKVILRNTSDGIAVISEDCQLLFTNLEFRNISTLVFGDSPNAGDDFNPFIQSFFPDRFKDIEQLIRSETRLFTTASFKVKDHQFFFDVEFCQEEKTKKRILYIRDVTEKENAMRDLMVSEEKFRVLVDRMLAGVYVIEEDKVVYVNEQLKQIFGTPSSTTINEVQLDKLIYHEDLPLVRANIQKRLSGEVDHMRYEARGIRRDGTVFWFEVLGNVSTYQGRKAIVGTLIDITERKKAEEHTVKQLHALEEISFITSHELRHEHAKLNGIIQLLQHMDIDDEELKTLLIESSPIFESMDVSIRKLNQYVKESRSKFSTT